MVTFCPLVSADAIVKETVTDFEIPGILSSTLMVLETKLTDPPRGTVEPHAEESNGVTTLTPVADPSVAPPSMPPDRTMAWDEPAATPAASTSTITWGNHPVVTVLKFIAVARIVPEAR